MTTLEFDAWVIDALHRADAPREHLAAVSDRWRPLAGRLASLPLGERADAFRSALAALPRDEADAIEAAMERNPSDGPPPIPTGPTPGPDPAAVWGPFRLWEPPKSPPFPLDALPPPARDLAEAAALSIGCPVDYVAASCLGVAAGAIGRSASLLLKPGYFAQASVYLAIVGPASDGKSPALDAAARVVQRIDRMLRDLYDDAVERWRAECDAPGPDGKPKRESEKPPRPVLLQFDADDMTLETMPRMLMVNVRGLAWIKDELSGLVGGFGQFKGGRGNDKEAVLSAWSGKRIKKSRVADEHGIPVVAPHPCLSIVGATTPGNLAMFIDPARPGDGFMERFLFSVPEPIPLPEEWEARGVPDDTAEAWAALVMRLWQRPMNGENPHVCRMTADAEAAWGALHKAHRRGMNAADFNPAFRGAWGKLQEYAGRLALVLCLMEHASDPTADPMAAPDVSARHVANAWRLVDYFKAHAERARAGADPTGAGPHAAEVRAIFGWIKAERPATFTERDVYRARAWIKPDALAESLAHLAKVNAIRPKEAPAPGPKGGRRPSPSYEVNPAVLA